MQGVWGAVIGSVVAFFVVWILALNHHYDLIPADYRAAIGSVITAGLSFLGGWAEHRRAERNGKQKEATRNGGNHEE